MNSNDTSVVEPNQTTDIINQWHCVDGYPGWAVLLFLIASSGFALNTIVALNLRRCTKLVESIRLFMSMMCWCNASALLFYAVYSAPVVATCTVQVEAKIT